MKSKYNNKSIQRSVPLPSNLKEHLRRWNITQSLWSKYRNHQLSREYEHRREHYAKLADELSIVYQEKEIISSVRQRLKHRGYTPETRCIGDIHTFVCFPLFSWHKHLLPDLHELGPVSHFDYTSLGFSHDTLIHGDRKSLLLRQEMLELILPAIRDAHRERPIDWVFFYGGGQIVSPAVVNQITDELGIPVVNMSLDDKQGWSGRWMGDCRSGAIDITSAFDLFMTSARVACKWHMIEGGRPIYLPEGFNNSAYKPQSVERDIPVSFVGAAYGPRTSIVQYLRKNRVTVDTFGKGWHQTGWVDNIVEIFNRSIINLGIGGIQYSEKLTNVKGRDFEIPGTGGGVYLTSFNPDLAQHYVVGDEILCYRNRDEMLELIRYYLEHPEEADEISRRGRERCLREHRWLHRYQKMLRILGVLEEKTLALTQPASLGKTNV